MKLVLLYEDGENVAIIPVQTKNEENLIVAELERLIRATGDDSDYFQIEVVTPDTIATARRLF